MAAGGEHGSNGLQEHAGALEEGRGGVENQAGRESSEQTLNRTGKQPMLSVQFVQKILAEIFGTYMLIFAGCASVTVNLRTGGTVTFPGICITWGLTVMVMVYSVGHISGAHFNPAVTFAFATCGRFPWKQVPAYAAAQLLGSTAASITLRLLFGTEHFFGTVPAGSDVQSLVLEFIITFYLMFVVSGVATDNRAIGELAGLAVGSTVVLVVLFAGGRVTPISKKKLNQKCNLIVNGGSITHCSSKHGVFHKYCVLLMPISGASMNPARTLGPAMIIGRYKGIWVYIVGPVGGAVAGAWAYNLIRFTDKPLREITRTGSFLRSARMS